MKLARYILAVYRRFRSRRANQKMKALTLAKVSEYIETNAVIKVDIGAGETKRGRGWLTLDNNSSCDLYWDLMDGLPFPDCTVTCIYASHVFEHIPGEYLPALLNECHRVLKDGGSLSVCVPNARLYLQAYLDGTYFITSESPSCWRKGWIETGSPIDQVNYIAYMHGEHRFMFDESNLKQILHQAGFRNVSMRNFDSALDLPNRDFESIYAVGCKQA